MVSQEKASSVEIGTLDRFIVLQRLTELKTQLEQQVKDLSAKIDDLKDRLVKVEVSVGVQETGLGIVANALELHGILKSGEAGQPEHISESKKEPVAAVKEETFTCLTFEQQKGERLGDYGTASLKNNIPDKFHSAFNILSKSNAVISNRYRGEGYVYSYWLYHETIYRQKLKPKTEAKI